MSLAENIGVISGLLAMAGGVTATVRWCRKVTVVRVTQDPDQPVTKLCLDWIDVGRGISLLEDDAREFEPDVLVGINRGGAIIGGMLVKRLRHRHVRLIAVQLNREGTNIIECGDVNISDETRVLLIDDARRSGRHLHAACQYLANEYPSAIVRRVVLLDIRAEVVLDAANSVKVDFSPFHTYDGRVLLPWDADRAEASSVKRVSVTTR